MTKVAIFLYINRNNRKKFSLINANYPRYLLCLVVLGASGYIL